MRPAVGGHLSLGESGESRESRRSILPSQVEARQDVGGFRENRENSSILPEMCPLRARARGHRVGEKNLPLSLFSRALSTRFALDGRARRSRARRSVQRSHARLHAQTLARSVRRSSARRQRSTLKRSNALADAPALERTARRCHAGTQRATLQRFDAAPHAQALERNAQASDDVATRRTHRSEICHDASLCGRRRFHGSFPGRLEADAPGNSRLSHQTEFSPVRIFRAGRFRGAPVARSSNEASVAARSPLNAPGRDGRQMGAPVGAWIP